MNNKRQQQIVVRMYWKTVKTVIRSIVGIEAVEDPRARQPWTNQAGLHPATEL